MSLFQRTIFLIFGLLFLVSCSTSPSEDEIEVEFGEVTDVEGNNYITVVIGDQEWMADYLVASRYRDGSEISYNNFSNPSAFREFGSNKTGAWTYYNDSGNLIYNVLYNWYAVNDSRGICPVDWKIPDIDDWNILIDYLGNNSGGKLKSTDYWESPNTGATNSKGFSAFPTGRFIDTGSGVFANAGYIGYWWSSSISNSDSDKVYGQTMRYDSNEVLEDEFYKEDGAAVRCIRVN